MKKGRGRRASNALIRDRRSLTTRRIVFLVIAAAAPLAAMIGNVPLALVYGNGAGLPVAYLVASIVLICFSIGYAAMSRRVVNTGAFYTYISRALGKEIRYSGPTFTWISLTLEPVQDSYRAFLEVRNKKQKHHSGWKFDDGTRHPLLGEDTP